MRKISTPTAVGKPRNSFLPRNGWDAAATQQFNNEVRLCVVAPNGVPGHFAAEVNGELVVLSSRPAAARAMAWRQFGERRMSRIPQSWNDMSIEGLWHRLNSNRSTPQVTIEAILYAIRERGLAALKEPATVERLSRCDAAAEAEIRTRIARQHQDERKI